MTLIPAYASTSLLQYLPCIIRRTRGHCSDGHHSPRSRDRRLSVARKLFGPYIVFIYSRITKSLAGRRHHVRRAGNVIDGTSHGSHLREEHFRADMSCPSLPRRARIGRASQDRDKAESWIFAL